jgi:hypothetical protein
VLVRRPTLAALERDLDGAGEDVITCPASGQTPQQQIVPDARRVDYRRVYGRRTNATIAQKLAHSSMARECQQEMLGLDDPASKHPRLILSERDQVRRFPGEQTHRVRIFANPTRARSRVQRAPRDGGPAPDRPPGPSAPRRKRR